MMQRIALALLLLVLAGSASAPATPAFSDVYFFGASNLDTGNFLNHPFWSTQPFAPIPENGYYRGRWQSGPSQAEFFAATLGHSAEASSNGGTNYSFGASGTSPHPGEIPQAPGTPGHALYLSTQIDQALADHGGALDRDALYVFATGDNDPFIFGRTPAEAPTAAAVVIAQMERLRAAGARYFIARTLPPGQDPYATPFNEALLDGVGALRTAGAVVYPVVLAAEFVQQFLTVDYLASIGITAFGPGVNCRADAACQAAASAAALADTVYDNQFLFFDGVGPHFNHRVHAVIAEHALGALAPPESGPYLTSPELPDFRFKVRITNATQTIAGNAAPDCVADTLCVSGAKASRTELVARVIGPFSNGFQWISLARFTPSRVEVWAEQLSTGALNYYDLPALAPDGTVLSGLVDKDAFDPSAVAGVAFTPEEEGEAVGLGAPATFVSPTFPDHRFTVQIFPSETEQAARLEADCIPETVCVSGAKAGRTEVFLRIIGPRLNGFLWLNLVRLTTSRVEVAVERISTGEVEYYSLPKVAPGSAELPSLVDKEAFLP